MEKNFEKLSIEEMSLVSGGFACEMACGVAVTAATLVASPTVLGAAFIGIFGGYVCNEALCRIG